MKYLKGYNENSTSLSFDEFKSNLKEENSEINDLIKQIPIGLLLKAKKDLEKLNIKEVLKKIYNFIIGNKNESVDNYILTLFGIHSLITLFKWLKDFCGRNIKKYFYILLGLDEESHNRGESTSFFLIGKLAFGITFVVALVMKIFWLSGVTSVDYTFKIEDKHHTDLVIKTYYGSNNNHIEDDYKQIFDAIFIDTSILKPSKKKSGIGLSTLDLRINTKIEYKNIVEVNVKPMTLNKYKINITYKKNEEKLKENNNNYCSIDLGLNNLMTLTSNKVGLRPTIVNGRPLKSINQFYNKQKSKYQSELPKKVYISKKINKLTEKRNNKINDYLHKSSNFLINYCLTNSLNTIVIGYNEGWKCEINIGKKNNQNFVNIPFNKLLFMIEYKCKLNGLNFKTIEESYTSKCSFLDLEPIKKQDIYKGKRIKRGLFTSNDGTIINSDVNGSLNILRKAVPTVFTNGIEGFAANPKTVKSFK